MKKLVIILFVAVAFFSLTQMAIADQVTYLGGPYRGGLGGGEFTMRPSPPGGTLFNFLNNYVMGVTRDVPGGGYTNTFQTFCIEWNEHISGGGVYNAVLNTKAVNGGVGPAGDPISKGTAWLYSQFAAGVLANYKFLGTEAEREASAGALQKAIWFLEDEPYGENNSFVTAAIAAVVGDVKADAEGAYGVMALNLYNSDDGSRAQDVLIKTPEPLTLLLLGLGLLGVAGIRRKLS